jgi:hypothetical protein
MTTNVRAVFLHNRRLADVILTLKFDRYLDPTPDQTVIFYGPHEFDTPLKQLLQTHGIDCDKIEVMPDWHLWSGDPPIDVYKYGGWIAQQFIKFMAIDYLSQFYDAVLIQDCDTFNIKPYNWITQDGNVQMYGHHQKHSAQYYKYVEIFTGHPRQTDYCLISEFMPMKKTAWQSLRQHLTQDNDHWLQTLDLEFEKNKLIEEDYDQINQIWFAEPELLGNWNLLVDPSTGIVEQHRFQLDRRWKERLDEVSSCNVIANYSVFDIDEVDLWARKFQSLCG